MSYPYPFRVEHFDCDCDSWDHSMRFCFDPTEDDVRCLDIWVDAAFPTHRTLWQRIVLAYKYITRTGPMDYSYGSWMLKHADYKRLRNFLTEYDIAVFKLTNDAKEKREMNGDQPKDGL